MSAHCITSPRKLLNNSLIKENYSIGGGIYALYAESSDLLISNTEVSEHILYDDGQYSVIQVKSTNATFNDTKIM